ncbi:uncharacterized protein PB1A10.02 [Trichoderma asperellum]|uniref:Uncharacterized protein PB1A10.02 n=1 Tax=Trichoderma asperellum TaxID=101201 RepID=A0A6V8QVW5_TRIAP|nr:uncharacterized protein PB1A10.02 [Trichoderma asperellum]
MEPPAKRRRMSQLLLDKANVDEDDDELALQPFEVEAKRDPDYKLSIERAYADQRFQATMAHIFDKYGRDFEGIGDEIDLVTGEIVVNNGHVRNMRDEGDVGGGLREYLGEEEDDEDEGILLEDLFDDEEEFGDEDTTEQEGDATVSGKQIQNDIGTDDDDEDRIIQGHEAPRESHSTALVLGSMSANARGVSRTSLRPLPHKIPQGNILGLETTGQLPFASSPLSFDRSPFAMEPWSFSGQYSDPLWNQPDLFTVHQPKSQQLPVKASRYDFPAQSGQSSIWAPRSKFRDEENKPLQSVFAATFEKHLLAKRKKILRHPLLLPPTKDVEDDDKREEEDEDEDEDEDVILTGKKTKEVESFGSIPVNLAKKSKDLYVNNQSSETSKELEEKGVEGGSSDSGYKSTQSTRKARKRKQRPDEDFVRNDALTRDLHLDDEIPLSRVNQSHQKLSMGEQLDEADGRRRSGRMRKQVEFLNKISWADVLAEQRAEKEAAYSRNRYDGQLIESEGAFEERPVLAAPEDDYVPDSAAEDEEAFEEDEEEGADEGEEKGETRGQTKFHNGLAILREKGTRQPDIHDEPRLPIPEVFPRKNADSACLLSDDEAPTLLSKSRRSISENTPKDVLPLREIQNTKTQTTVKAGSPASHKNKRLGYSHDENTKTKDAVEDASPILNKSGMGSGGYLDIPSEDLSGVVPLSPSPTRFSSRIVLEVSLDDKAQASYTSARKARSRQSAETRSSSPCARMIEDTPKVSASKQKKRQPTKLATTPIVIEDSSYETSDESYHVETSPIAKALSSPSRRTTPPPEVVTRAFTQSPVKLSSMLPPNSPSKSPSKRTLSTQSELPSVDEAKTSNPVATLPSLSNTPQTPRHSNRHSFKVPSSRHSILSLLSDDEDEEVDELGRNLAATPKLLSSAAQTTARKVWKSSSRTREVYHTPVKKRPTEPISPGSIIKTPGGTLRACGVDGYRCGRDFCFTCL